MHIPCTGNIPSRQPAGRAWLSQTVGAFITTCACNDIPSLIWVSGSSEESYVTFLGISKVIIVCITLAQFLESKVIKERNFTVFILHPPAVKAICRTILSIRFHTCINVDNMRIIKHIIIWSSSTEVIAQHLILRCIIKTSLRQDRHRKCIRIIRIFIQPWVTVDNRAISHSPVCQCLVWVFAYFVLLWCGGILQGA